MTVDHPLRLAVGSHKAGSGKGCAMNLISWENGDTTITDMPSCADPMLARIVQRVNDTYCTHRDGDLLCPTCSLVVLDLAHRTVGTSAHGLSPLELHRVCVRVAASCARQVAHLNTDPRVMAAIVAAEAWAENPTASSAAAAYAASAASDSAAAASSAAYASASAASAADRLAISRHAIDLFIELAGINPTCIASEAVAVATERMLAS
jgi:hypothetical protein